MSSPVLVLLLQQAVDPTEADRAWGRMATWEVAYSPSRLQRQIDHALALARGEAKCSHDPGSRSPHEPEDQIDVSDGVCAECGQPVQPACTCVLSSRTRRHAKYCPRHAS